MSLMYTLIIRNITKLRDGIGKITSDLKERTAASMLEDKFTIQNDFDQLRKYSRGKKKKKKRHLIKTAVKCNTCAGRIN